jgi:hypothetical protein
VPSIVPGAAPHKVRVTRFVAGSKRWNLPRVDAEWRQLEAARMAGVAVAMRGRVHMEFGARGQGGPGRAQSAVRRLPGAEAQPRMLWIQLPPGPPLTPDA